MRTFSHLKGSDVYDRNGDLLGSVWDVSISADGKVNGLLLKTKSLTGKKMLLPMKHVTFGKDCMIVHNKDDLKKYKENEDEYTMSSYQPIMRKNILSAEGKQLGKLNDVYFLEELGTIIGYELTDGFFSDMTEGKQMIPIERPPKIGKDAIIISENVMRGGVSDDQMSKLPKQRSR